MLCGAARKYLELRYKYSRFGLHLSLILFKLPNLFTYLVEVRITTMFTAVLLDSGKLLLAGLLLQRADLKSNMNKGFEVLILWSNPPFRYPIRYYHITRCTVT